MDDMTGIKRILFMGVLIGFTLIAILLLPTNKDEDTTDQPAIVSEPISNDDIVNPGNVPDEPVNRCEDQVGFLLVENPDAFESQESGEEWCNQCLADDGVIAISYDAMSAYCRYPTGDAGTECSNSNQCEGLCLAESLEDTSGKCSEYDQLEGGCGWYEVIDGEVAELCVD